MAFVKGTEAVKYFRKRARELVKGKGRLLTFALVVPEPVTPGSKVVEPDSQPTLRAYYGALGDDGAPSVLFVEEAI